MNKLIIAMTLVATAVAALPANAAPRNTSNSLPSSQSTIKVGEQCFKPTDARGYGYWDSCDNVYAFTIGRRGQRGAIDSNGADGGGGDGGGGGGGGGR